MADLTLKRMDAAIDRIVGKVLESCLDPENSVDYSKALKIAAEDGFLAGMKEAEKIAKDRAYDADWHIRATVKRLRKEMKNA